MTVAANPHLMSLAEWRALGEDTVGRSELQEGVRIVSPRPGIAHMDAVYELWMQLREQMPNGFRTVAEVDVVVDPQTPATVRAPDLVVYKSGASAPLPAADVVVVIEILSPGTRRVDRVTKRSEYADAGIRAYWIVDLDGPRLTELTLAGGEYSAKEHVGEFTTTVPFGLRIDLTTLTRS
ncbi:Uma2 family endonuclease [Tsukamurella soli]